MKLRKISKLFILCCIMSCSYSDGVLKTNISQMNEPYRELIYDSNGSYVIGQKGKSADNRNYQTIIFKSREGNLKSWEPLRTLVPGINYRSFINGDFIYMLNQIYVKELSLQDAQTVLFRLNRHSSQLDTLFNFGNEFIKSMHFQNEKTGYIFSRLDGVYNLKKTDNGGQDWKPVYELDGIIDKTLFKDNKLYFTSWTKDAKDCSLYSINFNGPNPEMINKNDFKIKEFYIEDNGDYWLLVDGNKNGSLLYSYKSGTLSEINSFDASIKAFHKYGNFIAVLTYGVDEGLFNGLGGTRYNLKVSYDNGDKWKQILLPIDTYVKPYTFHLDKLFIAYSGDGSLTYVDFDKYK